MNGEKVGDMTRDELMNMMRSVLAEDRKTAEAQNDSPEYYTREQVCEKLHVGLATFHNYVNTGKLHVCKIGRRTLIPARELDQAIETKAVFRYAHK